MPPPASTGETRDAARAPCRGCQARRTSGTPSPSVSEATASTSGRRPLSVKSPVAARDSASRATARSASRSAGVVSLRMWTSPMATIPDAPALPELAGGRSIHVPSRQHRDGGDSRRSCRKCLVVMPSVGRPLPGARVAGGRTRVYPARSALAALPRSPDTGQPNKPTPGDVRWLASRALAGAPPQPLAGNDLAAHRHHPNARLAPRGWPSPSSPRCSSPSRCPRLGSPPPRPARSHRQGRLRLRRHYRHRLFAKDEHTRVSIGSTVKIVSALVTMKYAKLDDR